MTRDGLLRSFEASGHAGAAPRGANIACAAATALLRTAGRVCAARGIVQEGGAEERGTMRCIVGAGAAADRGWLRGATDFLLRGLEDLRAEFPGAMDVDVTTTEE